jgi:hypothetical protein
VLARVLKLGLENPQMTAQVYNAIAESILQDTKNVGAARQSLQLAHKSSSALRDLPSLITALRLSNRTLHWLLTHTHTHAPPHTHTRNTMG